MEPDTPLAAANEELADFLIFDLSCSLDDREEPTRVTVYSGAGTEVATQWISIGVDGAVDLADVA